MQKNLDRIVNNFKRVVAPSRDALHETIPNTLNAVAAMISKYNKLIAAFEKTGQTDKIALLEKQLVQLNKTARLLRDKTQDQLHEHNLKTQKEINLKHVLLPHIGIELLATGFPPSLFFLFMDG